MKCNMCYTHEPRPVSYEGQDMTRGGSTLSQVEGEVRDTSDHIGHNQVQMDLDDLSGPQLPGE